MTTNADVSTTFGVPNGKRNNESSEARSEILTLSSNHEDGATSELSSEGRCPTVLLGLCGRQSWTARSLLFWICCACCTQSMLQQGFMNVNVTTIEKRFNLKSRSSGTIISSLEIGVVSMVAPLSYLGSRPGVSRPHMLGTCLIFVGLSSYMFMLPHFMLAPYEVSPSNDSLAADRNLCLLDSQLSSGANDLKNSEDEAGASAGGAGDVSNFLYWFIAAGYVMGLFSSPLFNVGAAFIDESVSPEKSPFYIGFLVSAVTVGPSIAYGVGGQLLQVYIDAPTIDPADYGVTPSSDRWLGAWWIGYLVTGTLCITIGLNIFTIPKVIPSEAIASMPGGEEVGVTKKKKKKKTLEASSSSQMIIATPAKSAYDHFDDFLHTSQTLLSNWTFVFLSLAKAGETFIIAGLSAFMPKFMETQYEISASSSAMSMGAIGLFAGAVGTFVGGWLVKHFKMSCESVLKFCFIISLGCVSAGAVFLIRCPNKSFAGVYNAYTSLDNVTATNVTSDCNVNCSCSSVAFSPVCGANAITYFSPCHAGCTHSNKHSENEVFSGCVCVESYLKPLSGDLPAGHARLMPDQAVIDGCPPKCRLFGIFLGINLVLFFISVLTAMPHINGTMRCVASDQRAYALGLQSIPVCLLGTIPGTIVFGAVVDGACTLWSDTSSGAGSCVVYDNYALGRYMFVLTLSVRIVVVFCLFVAWRSYHEPAGTCGVDDDQASSRDPPSGSSCSVSREARQQSLDRDKTPKKLRGQANEAFID